MSLSLSLCVCLSIVSSCKCSVNPSLSPLPFLSVSLCLLSKFLCFFPSPLMYICCVFVFEPLSVLFGYRRIFFLLKSCSFILSYFDGISLAYAVNRTWASLKLDSLSLYLLWLPILFLLTFFVFLCFRCLRMCPLDVIHAPLLFLWLCSCTFRFCSLLYGVLCHITCLDMLQISPCPLLFLFNRILHTCCDFRVLFCVVCICRLCKCMYVPVKITHPLFFVIFFPLFMLCMLHATCIVCTNSIIWMTFCSGARPMEEDQVGLYP